MGPYETKTLYTAKETVNKIKRQLTKREKIFANNSADKGLISKIYKELIQLNTKPKKKSNYKMGRRREQTLLPRRLTNGQQIYEKMLNFTSYWGNANQTTMTCYLKPVRMAVINKTNNKFWRC